MFKESGLELELGEWSQYVNVSNIAFTLFCIDFLSPKTIGSLITKITIFTLVITLDRKEPKHWVPAGLSRQPENSTNGSKDGVL